MQLHVESANTHQRPSSAAWEPVRMGLVQGEKLFSSGYFPAVGLAKVSCWPV